ncbi:hypothetical protein FHS95_000328 [Sphingomonas naasensis]|uniref:Glycosyltransferase n=1 Tax=Sphingomonas naasensis TaxID=1344951 RepID=A0A4S1WRA0_9SPHN|nr:hypothetical protein [Sphingomonas naasensis]NIJ18659.1 hypothetical protein [Sphingomonas naasensis]TGX45899.1 hypothetical protein E5A74_01625 [Sphingomonas naasensis]
MLLAMLTASACALRANGASALLAATMVVAGFPAVFQFAICIARLALRVLLRPLSPRRQTDHTAALPPLVIPFILRKAGDMEVLRRCVDENLPHVQRRPMMVLLDGPDSRSATAPEDHALLELVRGKLAQDIATGDVALLVRRRRYDPVDGVWRGWERKRGKIVEFCRLAQGGRDTDFIDPLPRTMRGLTEFVAIDVDTLLTPCTIMRLAEAVDDEAAIVVPAIEDLRRPSPSWFERLQAPYWCARPFDPRMSFNQDYLGRDLFFGKGLIVVDRFLDRTEGRIADRTVLSHDHLEAMLAGAVFNPAAVVREWVPPLRSQWAARQHRWMRGDFQIVPWLVRGGLRLSARFHLALVICAQLTSLGSLVLLATALLAMPWPISGWIAVAAIAIIYPPALLMPLEALWLFACAPGSRSQRLRRAGALLVNDAAAWLLRACYTPGDAMLTMHAGALVAWRRLVTGRNMLAWSDATAVPQPSPIWMAACACAGAAAIGGAFLAEGPMQAVGALVAFWLVAPLVLERGAVNRSARNAVSISDGAVPIST